MELNNLKPAKGAIKSRKRVGRGVGSGHGRTATRGTKGAKSRSGYKHRYGFEGGQMPLHKRVPKIGFKNINRQVYAILNLDRLNDLTKRWGVQTITPAQLYAERIVKKNRKIKILGRGTVKEKLEVQAHAFSASAKKAIEAQGGKAIVIQ